MDKMHCILLNQKKIKSNIEVPKDSHPCVLPTRRAHKIKMSPRVFKKIAYFKAICCFYLRGHWHLNSKINNASSKC